MWMAYVQPFTITIRLRAFMVISLFTRAFCSGAADSAVIEAGVARVNLTPPLEMKAILGGYGERMSKPAVGVHDSVWAKAVVIRQGDRRFALVTADALG